MEKPTPRVNQRLLSEHVGQVVRIVGKVIPIRQSQTIMLETSDQGQVTVHTNPASVYNSKFVEVIGTVNNDLSVQELTFSSFGDNFDLATYNDLVHFSHQFKEIFG